MADWGCGWKDGLVVYGDGLSGWARWRDPHVVGDGAIGGEADKLYTGSSNEWHDQQFSQFANHSAVCPLTLQILEDLLSF